MLIGLNEKVLEDKVKSKVVFHIEELTKQYEPTLGKFYFSGLPHIRVTVAKRILNEMFLFLGFLFSLHRCSYTSSSGLCELLYNVTWWFLCPLSGH